MDRRAPATPDQRDMMFCHQCNNQWYRDEHGFECPRCHSEFTEVIEANNDPREAIGISHGQEWADDPDEDDITQYDADHPDGGGGFRARFERTRSQDSAGAEQQAHGGGGLMGFLGSALRLASEVIHPGPAQHEEQHSDGQAGSSPTQNVTTRSMSPNGTTVTRHVQGNGFSWTFATTHSTNTLHPRDPNSAQPFNQQPSDFSELVQVLNNIGAFPGAAHGMPPAFGMGHDHFMGGGPGRPPNMAFPGALFQLLGLPVGGVHGDAVYSQEGLDRIITQLMEQHQTGNAPGPATENAIKSLPQRPITEKDLGESGTAECSICMEAVVLDEKVTVLPCEHWFHYDCIEAWLKEHDTCPHCRKGIMPGDNESAARQDSTQAQVPGAYPFSSQDLRNTSSSSRPGQSASVRDRMREVFGGSSSPSGSNRPD